MTKMKNVWKMAWKMLGEGLVQGEFGNVHLLVSSTYISLSVPVTSFGLGNAKIIKIEK